MNTLIKIKLVVAFILVGSLTAFSAPKPDEVSKAVKKAIEAVEDAESHDWRTLARSAEVCFKKKENIEQALQWIDKSLELNEDPYNLEVKGDYYSSVGKKQEAMEYYYKAITVGKTQDFWKDNGKLQQKIWDLRK